MKTHTSNERIVLVGGGSGVFRIARFLKDIRPNLTTIHTVFDHGGHSAQLRDERGVLPPGDLRRGILALADDSIEPLLRQLLSFRFKPVGSSIDGANMGNLILTALTEITGSMPSALSAMSQLCHVKGTVLPVSLDNAELHVVLSDGSTVSGEGDIDTRSPQDERTIVSAKLVPPARIYAKAYEAIVAANKIVFCPGDLWTSQIPNELVEGFGDAMSQTKAVTIMVVNLMTKKAETHGYAACDIVEKLCQHIGRGQIDAAICHENGIPADVLETYAREQSYPVAFKTGPHAREWVQGVFADWSGGIIRHNKDTASRIADL